MLKQFLDSVAKALVPLVTAGVGVLLQAVGVDLGANQTTLIAVGIVTSVLVWAKKNGAPVDDDVLDSDA